MAEEDQSLSRQQRRLLRRIYNGRTMPVVADGRSFLTYKEASRYLQALGSADRAAAYSQMKENAER
jgi:hypothetical protein